MSIGKRTMVDSDTELIKRYLKGDEEAFQMLVSRYEKPLYFFIYRMVGDHDEAADIFQKTFVQVFIKVKGFLARSSFKTWLYRVASNQSLNHIRARERQRTEPLTDDHLVNSRPPGPTNYSGAHASPDVSLAHNADREALRGHVRSLPDKQRITLVLRVYQEMTFKEIAHVMDCAEGTAKVNYHHAVTALRRLAGGCDEL